MILWMETLVLHLVLSGLSFLGNPLPSLLFVTPPPIFLYVYKSLVLNFEIVFFVPHKFPPPPHKNTIIFPTSLRML